MKRTRNHSVTVLARSWPAQLHKPAGVVPIGRLDAMLFVRDGNNKIVLDSNGRPLMHQPLKVEPGLGGEQGGKTAEKKDEAVDTVAAMDALMIGCDAAETQRVETAETAETAEMQVETAKMQVDTAETQVETAETPKDIGKLLGELGLPPAVPTTPSSRLPSSPSSSASSGSALRLILSGAGLPVVDHDGRVMTRRDPEVKKETDDAAGNAIVLADKSHAAKWEQCRRLCTRRDAPPLLQQKWAEMAGSKMKRKEMFDIFVACGGDVGKMAAHESVLRKTINEDLDGEQWYTRDDLLEKYHHKADKVDKLIAKKIKEGKSRPHKEFPDDPEMVEYKGYSESTSTSKDTRTHERAACWSTNLEGQTAMDFAQKAHETFDIEDMPSMSPQAKGKAQSKGTALKDDRKAKVKSKKKEVGAYAKSALELHNAIQETVASLANNPTFTTLKEHLEQHVGPVHGAYVELKQAQDQMTDNCRSVPAGAIKRTNDAMADAIELLKSGESVLGKKRKRELPEMPADAVE